MLHQSTGLRQCACACNCNPVMCLWQGAFNRALAKGKVALKLCTNRRLLTANRCILYILVHCKFYLKKGSATSYEMLVNLRYWSSGLMRWLGAHILKRWALKTNIEQCSWLALELSSCPVSSYLGPWCSAWVQRRRGGESGAERRRWFPRSLLGDLCAATRAASSPPLHSRLSPVPVLWSRPLCALVWSTQCECLAAQIGLGRHHGLRRSSSNSYCGDLATINVDCSFQHFLVYPACRKRIFGISDAFLWANTQHGLFRGLATRWS